MAYRFFTGLLAGLTLLVACWAGEAAAQSASRTQLFSAPNPSNVGQSVKLSADVDGLGAPPTGSVAFTDGALPLGSATLGAAAGANQQTLALGLFSACIMTSAGGVQCWGNNSNAELGNGTRTNSATPVDVVGLTSGVRAISTADFNACAVTVAGGAKCWGPRDYGMLGDGNTSGYSSVPGDVLGLTSGVVATTGGWGFNCALTSAGGVKCWGYNLHGELGNDDPALADRSTPVDVAGLTSGVTAISAGDFHVCAVMSTGGVKCWGKNDAGQLGNGTFVNQRAPVDVVGLTGVVAVAAGNYHTCALTNVGAVKCWGQDGAGQLGDILNSCAGANCGLGPPRSTPVDVIGLSSGVAAITVNRDVFFPGYSCALTTTGAAKCWGYGLGYSLGMAGPERGKNFGYPQDVDGLSSGVVSISAGGLHACAKLSDGRLKCWGCEDHGALGNPDYPRCAETPVDATSVAPTFVRAKAALSTAALALGAHSLTAAFTATSSHTGSTSPVLTQIVGVPTTTTLISSDNPSNFGQSITLTATVTGASGTPTGAIEFFDGDNSIGAYALRGGSASMTVNVLSIGSHNLRAVYSGDFVLYAGSTASLTQVVNPAATTTTLTSSLNPPAFGAAVTLRALVTAGSTSATGSVEFFDGATSLGSTALDPFGSGELTLSSFSAGSHSLTAVFTGDFRYQSSTSSPLTQVVNAATSTTSVVGSSLNPSTFGQSATLTATVASGFGTPTGSVEFFDGAVSLGTATLSGGSASLSISSLSVGPHSITASYGGSANHGASSSLLALSQTVNKAAPTVSAASTPNPSAFGQTVTVTATVSGPVGATTPTGTVDFYANSLPIGSATLSGGTASVTTSSLSVGATTFEAVYNGDANYELNNAVRAQTVGRASATVTLAAAATQRKPGETATLTATVAPVAPSTAPPTGTVSFRQGNTEIDSAPVNGAGVATFTTAALPLGRATGSSHSFTPTPA